VSEAAKQRDVDPVQVAMDHVEIIGATRHAFEQWR
jgi:hypothetical protein